MINNSTFLLMQEIWQHENKFIDNVKSIMPDIECVVVSPMDENLINLGRGKGGVAIIWKNSIKCKIDIIKCLSKRLCAIEVKVDDFKFILFNVYMPVDPGCDNHEINEYKSVLQEMSIFMLNSDTEYFILGADWILKL